MKYYSTFLVSFISVLIIAEILNYSGYFKKAVYTLLLATEGKLLKFYVSILFFSAFTVLIFNNICVVLIFLPVLYQVLKEIEFNAKLKLFFLYSSAVISVVSSICFVNSNILKLLYSGKLNIGFTQFANKMLILGIIGLIICTLFLLKYFRTEVKSKLKIKNIKNPDDMIIDWTLLNIGIAIMIILAIGNFLSHCIDYNYSTVPLICAVIYLTLFFARKSKDKFKV